PRRLPWARRRAAREPVLPEFAAVVRDTRGPGHPELVSQFDRIESVVRNEEETFLTTLTSGSKIFDLAATETKESGGSVLAGGKGVHVHRHHRVPHALA